MGGDRPALEIFPAVIQLSQAFGDRHTFVAFAHHSVVSDLKTQIDQAHLKHPHSIELVTTESFIGMTESPLLAIRRKKNSSMAAGMRLLAQKKIDAFVSMGNTGALVATAMLHLPKLDSIERCALLVMLPTAAGDVAVLDVGASIAPKPEHLLDWARLAISYRKSMHGIKNPTVGLLNVGVEEIKGTHWHKKAYSLLESEIKDDFLGNMEGREVFLGKIDVLVTDGFTGNVFLKTCEGVASFLTDYLADQIPKLGGPKEQPIVGHLHQQFNYSQRPGALLCGVDGIVVKCHGHSNLDAIANGILGAIKLAENKTIERMKSAGW